MAILKTIMFKDPTGGDVTVENAYIKVSSLTANHDVMTYSAVTYDKKDGVYSVNII